MTFDDADGEIGVGNIIGHVQLVDLALVGGIDGLFFHHTFPDGGHLGPAVGVDDGGNDVAPEGGTDLIEQVFVHLVGFLIFVIADFKGGTVGR